MFIFRHSGLYTVTANYTFTLRYELRVYAYSLPFKSPVCAFQLKKTAGVGKKKNRWSQEDMQAAFNACKNEHISVYAAAKRYNVPRMTLSDRMLGKVSLKSTTGHPLSLTREEEASIVSYVEYMHERRFPITRSQVISLAWAVDLKRESGRAFGENGPSLNWWRGFRNRHPELTFRTTESIDRGRVVNANEETIGQYFDLLKHTMHEHSLQDKPHLIFNCDESAIVLSKSARKVLVPRSTKHCHSIANASTQHVSVMCCFSAAGYAMPPMIVFSKGLPAGKFHRDGPINASYSSSKSGFVDRAIYTEWFKKTFLKFAPTERPLLLLQDGASAHMGPDLIEAAIANDVVLLCTKNDAPAPTMRRWSIPDDESSTPTDDATGEDATWRARHPKAQDTGDNP